METQCGRAALPGAAGQRRQRVGGSLLSPLPLVPPWCACTATSTEGGPRGHLEAGGHCTTQGQSLSPPDPAWHAQCRHSSGRRGRGRTTRGAAPHLCSSAADAAEFDLPWKGKGFFARNKRQ